MIRGVHHVGVSVADLDRSIAFYRDLLGMTLEFEGPFSGEQFDRILALEGAVGRVALLRAQDLQLELFQFLNPLPKAASVNRPVCNHGITHFCIEVDDVYTTYEALKTAGVVFHCPPLKFGPTTIATYGRDPDGNVFELLERSDVD